MQNEVGCVFCIHLAISDTLTKRIPRKVIRAIGISFGWYFWGFAPHSVSIHLIHCHIWCDPKQGKEVGKKSGTRREEVAKKGGCEPSLFLGQFRNFERLFLMSMKRFLAAAREIFGWDTQRSANNAFKIQITMIMHINKNFDFFLSR